MTKINLYTADGKALTDITSADESISLPNAILVSQDGATADISSQARSPADAAEMSGAKETGTAEPALVGGLYKVTNPTSEHFGQVGLLRTVITSPEGAPIGLRPFWIEFTDRVGLHHCHTQCDFARDDVEPYESEDTEPQELVAAETPQAEIERLRKVLDEVQTNQAEHATHLDLLQQNADSQRTNWAAERMRLNALAQVRENAAADRLLTRKNAEQVKECFDTIEAHRVWLRKIEQQAGAAYENTGAVLADIMGRLETLEVKDIQRSADLATANKVIDAMHYRRMVGNMFRRVADAVDGG